MTGRTETRRAFTIMELLVAMALLAVMVVVSGMVFQMAVEAHRRASAVAEITQKFQTITHQLDADFASLRKDGPIYAIWLPSEVRYFGGSLVQYDGNGVRRFVSEQDAISGVRVDPLDENDNGIPDRYERLDRLMFFASGDFHTYNTYPQGTSTEMVHGNVARITYMIPRFRYDGPGEGVFLEAGYIPPARRVLARSESVYTSDVDIVGLPDAQDPGHNYEHVYGSLSFGPLDPSNIDGSNGAAGVFTNEYVWQYIWDAGSGRWLPNDFENISLEQWLDILTPDPPSGNWITPEGAWMLTRALGVSAAGEALTAKDGLVIDRRIDPRVQKFDTFQMILSEGVANFSVQLWNESLQKWVPSLNPGGVLEDYSGLGGFDLDGGLPDTVNLQGVVWNPRRQTDFVTEGLGKALKFTFTLYDSHGIFPDGKTFTHIIHLND